MKEIAYEPTNGDIHATTHRNVTVYLNTNLITKYNDYRPSYGILIQIIK